MDQYLSTVVIAIITGVFSIITLVIQKKQDKVINKIDEQTAFIEKEKSIKQRLVKKQEEKESTMQEIMILILDTNLHLLTKSYNMADKPVQDVFNNAKALKDKWKSLNNDIQAINNEYNMLLELSNVFKNKNDNKPKEEKND